MTWLSRSELQKIGFAHLGREVRISSRAAIYDAERISIGDFSRVDDFCVLSGKLTIGRNVHIAVFVNLAGGELGIVLRDFSGISYGSHIFSQSDDYSGEFLTGPTVPARYNKVLRREVVIGRHVIVGAGSIILPGVTVADGCAVGAHSTVVSSTEPWGIYVGSPARFLRERKQDMLALEAEYLSESSVGGAGQE
jgi:acetyltransferase-like isoleucine patch superfamily enzyme